MELRDRWKSWQGEEDLHETALGDGLVESCSISTTDANDMMGQLHDRMPVILPGLMIDTWLDPKFSDTVALKAILQPYSSVDMQAWEVGKAVGNVKNQGPELMAPVGPTVRRQLSLRNTTGNLLVAIQPTEPLELEPPG